jgi:hypothetical protein
MRHIRQFFSDILNLPKHEFFRKYLLVPITILYIWLTAGNLFELTYSKEKLEFKEGAIVELRQVVRKLTDKPLYKRSKQEIHIKLDNFPEYFRLTDNFRCDPLIDYLKTGDTVTIYYRKKWLVLLGFGRRTDIYQLEYKNKIIFDLNQRKSNSKALILIGSIFSIIFGCLCFYLKHKRNKKATSNIA